MKSIEVIIKPNQPETKIVSKEKNVWKIDVKASAIQNKANIELIRFLKKKLQADIKIVRGLKSKRKVLKIIT